MKNQQSGFTLVELIMVIVVLGILAAFALPRFANFGGDARRAALEGALGTVSSASAIAHSAALARNETGATGTVELEGQTAIQLVHGYIAGTADDIRNAAQLSAEFGVTAASGVVTVTQGTCSFTYTQASAANDAPEISEITPATGGC